MRLSRTTSGLFLLGVLAFLGYLLVTVPPQLLNQYRVARDLGPIVEYFYLGVVTLGGMLLLGSSGWLLWTLWRRTVKKRVRRQLRDRNPSQLSRDEQTRELDENLAAVEELRADANENEEVNQELEPLVRQLEGKREQQQLEIVAFGTVSSGKSSILNAIAGRDVFQTDARGGTTVRRNSIPWPGLDQVQLVDTPGLGEINGAEHVHVATTAAKDADLVLVVVDGPLRESEFQLVDRLHEMEKRVLVCLNKEDWYGTEERQSLLSQITEQVQDHIARDDVVAVRAMPTHRTRMRVLSDGTESEELVKVEADIAPLAERMMTVVRKDGPDLLLANLLLQSRGLVEEARTRVRDSLDRRAWQIVDRYMWGAGGAAALSPLPIVDLVAGGAISTKMVVELARVYRQQIDADSAVKLLGELGKNLVAILGVSAATPAVVAGVASLLKAVPGIGTIAGGFLQGLVQAIITRWIGGVFIQYFKNEMQHPEGGLVAMARREWDKVTAVAELKKLVRDARKQMTAAHDE